MSIDFDRFLSWAESRFDDVIIKGDEILLNSIFCEDRKHHLWCNPSGGKKNHDNGVYHCWKSDEKGSLISLVMVVDKCTYDQAIDTLDAVSEGSIYDLEKRVQDIFDTKKENTQTELSDPSELTIPQGCYLFDDLPSSNYLKKAAVDYLKQRKISSEGLFVCTSGRYRNRIVIPYYDKNGRLFYYNGRYIGDPGNNLRYLGPPKELGIGKGDVLYAPRWPKKGEKLYVTEGEFDAMSLNHCGFLSAALGGKALSEKQMEMIKEYIPVLCFDADAAGAEALTKVASTLLSKGFQKVFYVRPCKEYKDWNGLLVEKGEKILTLYVNTQEKQYNSSIGTGDWEGTKLAMKNIGGR